MTEREVLRMALEALEYSVEELMGYSVDMSGEEYNSTLLNDAITAIREVLAQPDENAALLAANKDLKVYFDVLMYDYKKLSELCTSQGIRLMEAEDDLAQPERPAVQVEPELTDIDVALMEMSETADDLASTEISEALRNQLERIRLDSGTSPFVNLTDDMIKWVLLAHKRAIAKSEKTNEHTLD